MIQNIWAVGRNYSEHAKELGNEVPKEPLIFLKAGSCIQTGPEILLSKNLGEIHYETEMAVQFDTQLHMKSWTVALDLTDRTAQAEAKSKGLPWTKAKSFKGACVLGDWKTLPSPPELYSRNIQLVVNGELRQKAALDQMIFKLDQLRSYLLQHFPVQAGDILLTGTPSGVGPLKAKDELIAKIGDEIEETWVVRFED